MADPTRGLNCGAPWPPVLAPNVDAPQTIPGTAAQEWGYLSDVVLSPTASFTNLAIGGYSKLTYSGTVAPSGGGHVVGNFGAVQITAPGLTIPLAIGSEGIAYVTGGNVSLLAGLVGTVGGNVAGSTITSFIGVTSRVNQNAGTITEWIGFQPYIVAGANTGTISSYVGVDIPAPSMTGIAAGVAIRNTSGFPITSNSSVCDSSQQVVTSPATGSTVAITPRKSFVLLSLSGNLAALTLTMPPAPDDGQEICFLATANITALTLAVTSPITTYGNPTAMTGAAPFRMRYIGSVQTWARAA